MAIGARLCTIEELQNDETRGTGCGHDGEWVWSSETCDTDEGSHLVAVGGSNNGRNLCSGDGEECLPDQNPCVCNARCWAATENAGVRCCADVAGPACAAPEPPADPEPPVEPAAPDVCPIADGTAPGTGFSYLVPSFVDISASGTLITSWEQNADDGWFEVALPFTFPYYGLNEQVMHIGTNGYITFGAGHFAFGNSEPFPGTVNGPVDGVIGVYWADINPAASDADGAGVYYQAFGTDSMVVLFNNVVYWTG